MAVHGNGNKFLVSLLDEYARATMRKTREQLKDEKLICPANIRHKNKMSDPIPLDKSNSYTLTGHHLQAKEKD